jgi:hypothetical protein
MKKKIIVLTVALFLFTYFIPKAVFADNVWFSADCGHPGGQDQDCICVTKNCPNGDVTNGCTPEMGPNPSAATMQKIKDMYVCPSPQSTSAPTQQSQIDCHKYLAEMGKINPPLEDMQYIMDCTKQAQLSLTPTPTFTPTPTPTIYIPLATFTPTPTPTITPSPIIKHSTQIQNPINKNSGFTNNLLENVNKFFGTIGKFLKNLTGRR